MLQRNEQLHSNTSMKKLAPASYQQLSNTEATPPFDNNCSVMTACLEDRSEPRYCAIPAHHITTLYLSSYDPMAPYKFD